MPSKGEKKKTSPAKALQPKSAQGAPSLSGYGGLLAELKEKIRSAQIRAGISINREMVLLYWEIGRIISQRQEEEGWGTSVIPRLARDLHNELPEIKGFSERNIGRMVAFYHEYPWLLPSILPQPVAKLNIQDTQRDTVTLALQLPWGHNVLLMEKVKNLTSRLWYMHMTIEKGWSRNVLQLMIEGSARDRQGKAITNFQMRLPPPQSDLAQQTLKDPYLFDFLTIDKPFREREIETGLVQHLEKFLLELGQGFAFVGRQYHLDLGGEDFYIDLLFYHLKLRCFIVIDLKTGPFRPEYAGKMNFYLNVIDDRVRHESDNPSIGLILCQYRKKVIAEYALRGMNKPIGVSEYELTRALPQNLKSSLPSIEEIEDELGKSSGP